MLQRVKQFFSRLCRFFHPQKDDNIYMFTTFSPDFNVSYDPVLPMSDEEVDKLCEEARAKAEQALSKQAPSAAKKSSTAIKVAKKRASKKKATKKKGEKK